MRELNWMIKKGEIKVMPESLDDLWLLHSLIEIGDTIEGKTIRKIKRGGEDQRKSIVIKKPVFLQIQVEKANLENNALRVSGKTTKAHQDIPKGSYHTFSIEENSEIAIIKQKWFRYQLDKIKEACREKEHKILILVHDREEAYFAIFKKYGYITLSHIKGTVQKKSDIEKVEGKFYPKLLKNLEAYDAKYNFQKIIIASPAFWKEDLLKQMKNNALRKKIILATCSSVGNNGIDEVIKRPETKEALREVRVAKETALVEELLTELGKKGMAIYGFEEIKKGAMARAVKKLLISDEFIQKSRETDTYPELEEIIKIIEQTKGEITLISGKHDAGKKLNGLGGIAGILRFQITY